MHCRRPIIRQNEMAITGKNETPPSLDTGAECTFRWSGMSKSLLLYETIRILGIIRRAIMMATANPPARKKKSFIVLFQLNITMAPWIKSKLLKFKYIDECNQWCTFQFILLVPCAVSAAETAQICNWLIIKCLTMRKITIWKICTILCKWRKFKNQDINRVIEI